MFGALADLYGRRRVARVDDRDLQPRHAAQRDGGRDRDAVGLSHHHRTRRYRRQEWATGHTYIGETFPRALSERYASLMQTGGAFGALMAAGMGGFLAPRLSWRACFLISAAPAVLSAFVRRACAS